MACQIWYITKELHNDRNTNGTLDNFLQIYLQNSSLFCGDGRAVIPCTLPYLACSSPIKTMPQTIMALVLFGASGQGVLSNSSGKMLSMVCNLFKVVRRSEKYFNNFL